MTALLEVSDVTAGYGESVVLENVSFALDRGERLALLGRNGVGKTTLIVTLMGFTHLHRGEIRWASTDLRALSPTQRARAGLGWVPQERGVFPSLTVDEHLRAVARPGAWSTDRLYKIFPRLEQRRANRGLQLSGGEQQMLTIARALATNPKLLLLDEPLEGLAPLIVEELLGVLRDISAAGDTAILLVEQHARQALALTDRALVLDRGTVVYEGSSQALLDDSERLNHLLAVS
ncbi:MAG TPA: ABC transporter ATP-binding protein [Polyangiaceae bacterium]